MQKMGITLKDWKTSFITIFLTSATTNLNLSWVYPCQELIFLGSLGYLWSLPRRVSWTEVYFCSKGYFYLPWSGRVSGEASLSLPNNSLSVLKVLVPLSSIYLREVGFSALVNTKAKQRNKLDVKGDLWCVLSNQATPDITRLVSQKSQHHPSHWWVLPSHQSQHMEYTVSSMTYWF